jgi:predicted MFS family arabinose efflux permease
MTRAARYRLVAALYGSQFIPLAFFLYGLSAVLRERGVPLGRIGLIQLVALVWVVKFAWAPLVDRWGSRRFGHYRPWLIATQTLMVLALLALSQLDVVRNLPLVVLLMVGLAVASATQDIATDATAVRLLEPSERGVGNGIQKAGGFFGLMVGGGGGLLAYDRWGWAPAMVLLAALTAAPLPLLLAYRERRMTAASQRHRVSMRTLAGFFHQPGAVRWAFAVLPVYLAGIAVAYPLVTPMLVDYGWPLDTIGSVWIVGGGGVAMVAALIAGGLLSAIRRRSALVGLALAQVAAIATLLLTARSTGGALVGLAAVVLLSGASAAVGTAVYTINMDWSRADSAATDYTVQDSFVHLCTQVAGAAGLALAGILGYTTVLTVAVILGLGGVTVAARVFQEQPNEVTLPREMGTHEEPGTVTTR